MKIEVLIIAGFCLGYAFGTVPQQASTADHPSPSRGDCRNSKTSADSLATASAGPSHRSKTIGD